MISKNGADTKRFREYMLINFKKWEKEMNANMLRLLMLTKELCWYIKCSMQDSFAVFKWLIITAQNSNCAAGIEPNADSAMQTQKCVS